MPQWHQRRFIPAGQVDRELYYLDLQPETFFDGRRTRRTRKALRRLGARKCFAEDDLYTTRLNGIESRDVERLFFGQVGAEGKRAVDFFSRFRHDSPIEDVLEDMLLYLSRQKLRTPKGLAWLTSRLRSAICDPPERDVRVVVVSVGDSERHVDVNEVDDATERLVDHAGLNEGEEDVLPESIESVVAHPAKLGAGKAGASRQRSMGR